MTWRMQQDVDSMGYVWVYRGCGLYVHPKYFCLYSYNPVINVLDAFEEV